MNVNAGHRVPETVEYLPWVPLRFLCRCNEMGYCLGQECPGAAGGVQHSLIQRVVHQFPDHGAGQPGGCVVFTQLPALIGRNDGLVQVGGGVWRGLGPVEPGDPAGQGLHQGDTTHLVGPGEEVRFQYSL